MFIDFNCSTTLCSPGRKVKYLSTLNVTLLGVVLIEMYKCLLTLNATLLCVALVER